MARTTGLAGVSVSSKVFAILDCFGAETPALTLTDIATSTGMPLSTVRRLLGELTGWGALERLPNGAYRVGMRLWEVGILAARQRGLREAASPYMQDLYEAAKQNVQLAVLDGLEALCVERIYGKQAVPTETDVGGRMPLHATAAGKALLTFSPPEVLRSLLNTELERYTPHTLTDPTLLAATLEPIRTTGLAYSHGERALGAVAVASPILGVEGRLLGTIGIIAPIGTRTDRLGPAVRTAALTISRILGSDPRRRPPPS